MKSVFDLRNQYVLSKLSSVTAFHVLRTILDLMKQILKKVITLAGPTHFCCACLSMHPQKKELEIETLPNASLHKRYYKIVVHFLTKQQKRRELKQGVL